jgi:hypothetical protein
MRPKTGVHWLDDLVEEAGRKGIPALMDREDSRILYSRIVGHDVPIETYRRIDGIPTRNVHGRAKQDPKDVIARAKRAIEEAPRVLSAQPLRRSPRHNKSITKGK